MLALYICVGTGVLVWLWLVWDMAREARARPAGRSSRPSAPDAEITAPKREPKPKPKREPKPKAGQRRPIQKVSYTRHRRKPAPKPPPDPETASEPPKPARDPREWMDEDYD